MTLAYEEGEISATPSQQRSVATVLANDTRAHNYIYCINY